MKPHEKYPPTPENIWNFRQNNPRLILEDARELLGLDDRGVEILGQILMARGVNKWFKVRRDLIAYKKQTKNDLKLLEIARLKYKGTPRYGYMRVVCKMMMEVRANLRRMCMTDRWQEWPELGSHHREMKAMNSIKASD